MPTSNSRFGEGRERSRTFRETWPERAMVFAVVWFERLGGNLEEVTTERVRRIIVSVLRARVRELEASGRQPPVTTRRISQLWGTSATGHAGSPLSRHWKLFLEGCLNEGVGGEYVSGHAKALLKASGRTRALKK